MFIFVREVYIDFFKYSFTIIDDILTFNFSSSSKDKCWYNLKEDKIYYYEPINFYKKWYIK